MGLIKRKTIDRNILYGIVFLAIILYSIIFFLGTKNFCDKKISEQEKVLTYEKQKLNNIFTTLTTYSDYINLRMRAVVGVNKINQYLQIQKIVTEANLLASKENYSISIYEPNNQNIFLGSLTNKVIFLNNEELKKFLINSKAPEIKEIGNEIFFIDKVIFINDYFILLKLPKNSILSSNKNYQVIMSDKENPKLFEEYKLISKHYNKKFLILFNWNLQQNLKDISIYFIFPLIIVIIGAILLHKLVLTYFSSHLNTLLEKLNGEEKSENKKYINDIYQEIIERNEFIIKKSKEIEKTFEKRLLGDYILGILSFDEIEKKIELNNLVYCGILEVEPKEQSLDDYIFYVKKLISDLEKKEINGIFLEREHIFLMSEKEFSIDIFEKNLKNFAEGNNFEIFGVVSIENITLKELPQKKKSLEKYLIYKERIKDKILLNEEIIESLKFNCSYFYPINTEQKLITKIQSFDLNGVLEIMKMIFSSNFSELTLSEQSVKRLKRIIVNGLEKIIIHLEIKNGFQDNDYFIKRELLNDNEFQKRTLEILKNLTQEYKNSKITEDSVEIKMKNFIETNYNREVSLLEFAEYMNFTPQYLSNIYKKTFGENFNISLNRYRIQKSIELFIDNKGEIKIKELGEKVGYSNTITYINNFKKFKKVTPTSFFEKYLRTREIVQRRLNEKNN